MTHADLSTESLGFDFYVFSKTWNCFAFHDLDKHAAVVHDCENGIISSLVKPKYGASFRCSAMCEYICPSSQPETEDHVWYEISQYFGRT
jgi:hypothetical protein